MSDKKEKVKVTLKPKALSDEQRPKVSDFLGSGGRLIIFETHSFELTRWQRVHNFAAKCLGVALMLPFAVPLMMLFPLFEWIQFPTVKTAVRREGEE